MVAAECGLNLNVRSIGMSNYNGFQYPAFCAKCAYRDSGVCSRICMVCVQLRQTDVPSKFEQRQSRTAKSSGDEPGLFEGTVRQ